uniref:Uncharacterized protein n=3 Tax=Guillardia theta TaxID=55529 RepID=A0A7S4PJI9_GUITH
MEEQKTSKLEVAACLSVSCDENFTQRFQNFFEGVTSFHQVFSGKHYVGAFLSDESATRKDVAQARRYLWETLSTICKGKEGFARRSYRFFPTLFSSSDEKEQIQGLKTILPHGSVIRLQAFPTSHQNALVSLLEEEGHVLNPTKFSWLLLSMSTSDEHTHTPRILWDVCEGKECFDSLMDMQ